MTQNCFYFFMEDKIELNKKLNEKLEVLVKLHKLTVDLEFFDLLKLRNYFVEITNQIEKDYVKN